MQPLLKTLWRLFKKLKGEVSYDPAIPLPDIYIYSDDIYISSEGSTALISEDTSTPIFTAVLFTIAKTVKQHKCPLTVEWIENMWCVYIHKGIILSHKTE